jgi:DNA-binding CsgD family transcriptional regulator
MVVSSRKPSFEAVADCVGAFYSAAHQTARWQDALDALVRLLDGSRACLFVYRRGPMEIVGSDDDPGFPSKEGLGAMMREPQAPRLLSVEVGSVNRRNELLDEPLFRRGELWQDWFRPRDMHDSLFCRLPGERNSTTYLDVNRGPRQPEMGGAERQLVGTIARHVARADAIGARMAAAKILRNTRHAGVTGGMLVSGSGRVISIDDAAASALEADHAPLRLVGGKLTAKAPLDHLALSSAIEACCPRHDETLPAPGTTMAVGCGPSAWTIAVSPASLSMDGRSRSETAALVHLLDTACGWASFGLTGAETALARLIVGGQSLKSAANDTGITYKSARTYLDRIFAKTSTHRQAELVAKLVSRRTGDD